MLDRIGLFYDSSSRGPGKVRDNLLRGLHKLGIEVSHNKPEKYTGWLHGFPPIDIPSDWLLGPNLFVVPSDIHPSFWNKKRNIVTPAKWTTDLYSSYISEPHGLFTWAVGIDTEKFIPSGNKTNDCLIYIKGDPYQLKDKLKEKLNKLNLSYEEVEYGSYSEEEFIEKTQASNFCVTLTRTESQGIAYQEILSMDVPCLVVDKPTWNDRPDFSFPATSAPYFDGRCGIKSSNLDSLDNFIDSIGSYEPRKYILENLSLEKTAQEYILLLENCKK